jgi:hypothetical protein
VPFYLCLVLVLWASNTFGFLASQHLLYLTEGEIEGEIEGEEARSANPFYLTF